MEVEKDIISPFIRKQFSLWLWDWGDCLINNSLYYGKTMSPEEISKKTDTELDNEIPSWRFFQQLIPYLTKYGIRVGIVSFSVQSIIKAYIFSILTCLYLRLDECLFFLIITRLLLLHALNRKIVDFLMI